MLKKSIFLIVNFISTLSFCANDAKNEPLTQAATDGNCILIDTLIKNNADINGYFDGGTPLLFAIQECHEKAAKQLIHLNADINLNSLNQGISPLTLAALKGLKKTVKLLLKLNADIESKSFEGYTPLYMAVCYNQPKTAKLLIRNNADINARNNKGQSVLAIAIFEESEKVVKLLLKHKVDLNSINDLNYPIHYAAQKDNQKILKMILKKTDVNKLNGNRSSALNVAIQTNKVNNIFLLLEKKADIESTNQELLSPLGYAVRMERPYPAIALLMHGASVKKYFENFAKVEITQSAADLPRIISCLKQALILSGTLKNQSDENGRGVLHWAVLIGDPTILKTLIDLKDEAFLQDVGGNTAHGLAVLNNLPEMAEIFEKHAPYQVEAKKIANKKLSDMLPKVLANLITEYLE